MIFFLLLLQNGPTFGSKMASLIPALQPIFSTPSPECSFGHARFDCIMSLLQTLWAPPKQQDTIHSPGLSPQGPSEATSILATPPTWEAVNTPHALDLATPLSCFPAPSVIAWQPAHTSTAAATMLSCVICVSRPSQSRIT